MTKVCKLMIFWAVIMCTLLYKVTEISAETNASKPAWILWKQVSSFSSEGGTPKAKTDEWVVERALDGMAACQEILEHVIDVYKKGKRHPNVEFTSSVGTNSGVAMTSGKDKDGNPWSFNYTYLCIPDTIDPRAPKR